MPTGGRKIVPPRPTQRSDSAEHSATFWWWRAPNDTFRTGQKPELEALLPGLSKHCFVWRTGWTAWHHAAEIAELRSAFPVAKQMPLVTPEKVEGLTEPPALPALYDLLCEAELEAITEPIDDRRRDESEEVDEDPTEEIATDDCDDILGEEPETVPNYVVRKQLVVEGCGRAPEVMIDDEPTHRDYALPPVIGGITDREATLEYAAVGLDPLALYTGATARDLDRTVAHDARQDRTRVALDQARAWLALARRESFASLESAVSALRRTISSWRQRLGLSRPLFGSPLLAQAMLVAALGFVLACGVAIMAAGLTRRLAPSKASVFVTVAGPGETWVAAPSIFLDGELRCNMAPCRIDMPAGLHFMAVSAPGFARSADRAVRAKGEQVVHFELVHGSIADANSAAQSTRVVAMSTP